MVDKRRGGEPKNRRDYNQAFFTGIYVDVEHDELRPKVAKVRRTPVFAAQARSPPARRVRK